MDKQSNHAADAHQPQPRRVDPLAMMTVALGTILVAFAAIVGI